MIYWPKTQTMNFYAFAYSIKYTDDVGIKAFLLFLLIFIQKFIQYTRLRLDETSGDSSNFGQFTQIVELFVWHFAKTVERLPLFVMFKMIETTTNNTYSQNFVIWSQNAQRCFNNYNPAYLFFQLHYNVPQRQ